MATLSEPASMMFSSGTFSEGYPTAILGDLMNRKYQCWHCKMILRNPIQSYCGHRLCRDCMTILIRNNTDGNPIVCQSCVTEETVTEESYLKVDETFPDNAIRREMSNLRAQCVFGRCTWTGKFKEYESHVENCEFVTTTCGICNEMVLKSQLEEHLATHSTTSHLCPFGCEQQVDAVSLNNNVQASLVQHIEALYKKILNLELVLSGSQRPVEGHSISDRLADAERQLRQVEDKVRQHYAGANGNVTGTVAMSVIGAAGGEAAVAADAFQVQTLLSTTNEKMVIYEGVITVLNREVEKLTLQVEAIERQRQLERELLDTLDRKAHSLERLMAVKDATIAELELRLMALEQTSYDGTLLWRIPEFQRKRGEAISGQVMSIYSPPFYTSKTGYKMCARLYLNGDGIGKGTHVSLFFVVMRGAYDALLKWPFRQKVTLMFIDQNGREHVVDTFRPDPTSSSFKRPTTEMNIASGCPLMMPLTTLDSGVNAYVKDDTAFIKVIVNCDDLPPTVEDVKSQSTTNGMSNIDGPASGLHDQPDVQ